MFSNLGFWIVFGVLFLITGMIALLISDGGIERAITIFVALVIAFIFSALLFKNAEYNIDKWNDGTHIDCGGTYQLTTATEYRGSKSFYYTCDKCGHTEEFSRLMR